MSAEKVLRVLCLGDVVGRPGRSALKYGVPVLRQQLKIDLVIVNGENAAGGIGIDAKTAEEIRKAEVDIITLGDHAWHKKEAAALMESSAAFLIRPANYPPQAPGRGWTIWKGGAETRVGVLNVLGRIFLNSPLDCPFRVTEALLVNELKECSIIICDIHAEATSEKAAFARYFDGRMSLIVGTHTHVPTADEVLLPGGTGFISDLGMCGSLDGVIGMDRQAAVERFLSGLPRSYEVAKGQGVLQGVVCEIDCFTGKAVRLERIRFADGAGD
mgnify:CR=1 FL=1